MASRIINSPGVQINEVSESAIQSNVFGTDIFVTGFANTGPTDEIITLSSITEFESVYGIPTNAAERYFYYSTKPLFDTGATILTSRLPYGSGNGDGFGSQFSALVYPVVAVSGNDTTGGQTLTALNDANTDAYVLGKPRHFTLSKEQYLSCINGEAFNWSATPLLSSGAVRPITSIADFGYAGVVVFNTAQTTINERYEGYYVGLIDNSNNNPATQYDGIVSADTITTASTTPGYSVDTLVNIPSARLNFTLSGSNTSAGSLSQMTYTVCNIIP